MKKAHKILAIKAICDNYYDIINFLRDTALIKGNMGLASTNMVRINDNVISDILTILETEKWC